jgi:hypothetical protein
MGNGALSQRVKRPGREGDNSPSSSAEVKNTWGYTSTPQYVFMAWLFTHRDNFTFTFTLYRHDIYCQMMNSQLLLPFTYTSAVKS